MAGLPLPLRDPPPSRAPRAAVRVGVVPLFGAAAPASSAARRGVLAGQAIGRGDGHRARAVRPRVARRAVRARRVAPQDAPRHVAVAADIWLPRPRPRRGRGAAARVLGLRRGVRVEAPRVLEAPRPAPVPRRRPRRGRARRGSPARPRRPREARRGGGRRAPAAVRAEGGAVLGPIVPAATSADLRAGVEVRLALGLGLHGQPYTMLPRAGARAPLDSHHASARYRRNNYRSPPSPGARRKGSL